MASELHEAQQLNWRPSVARSGARDQCREARALEQLSVFVEEVTDWSPPVWTSAEARVEGGADGGHRVPGVPVSISLRSPDQRVWKTPSASIRR